MRQQHEPSRHSLRMTKWWDARDGRDLLRMQPRLAGRLLRGREGEFLRGSMEAAESTVLKLLSRSAHGHLVQLDGRHSDADRHALAVLAAGADALVELQIVNYLTESATSIFF